MNQIRQEKRIKDQATKLYQTALIDNAPFLKFDPDHPQASFTQTRQQLKTVLNLELGFQHKLPCWGYLKYNANHNRPIIILDDHLALDRVEPTILNLIGALIVTWHWWPDNQHFIDANHTMLAKYPQVHPQQYYQSLPYKFTKHLTNLIHDPKLQY